MRWCDGNPGVVVVLPFFPFFFASFVGGASSAAPLGAERLRSEATAPAGFHGRCRSRVRSSLPSSSNRSVYLNSEPCFSAQRLTLVTTAFRNFEDFWGSTWTFTWSPTAAAAAASILFLVPPLAVFDCDCEPN
jgi:hypothetical protein